MTLEEMAKKELDKREAFRNEVMDIIMENWQPGYAENVNDAPRLLEISYYVYSALGINQEPGKTWLRFLKKLLESNGYKKTFFEGKKVYRGLIPRKF